MLQAALEFEVEAYIESFKDEKGQAGRRQVVRSGCHKPRELITCLRATHRQAGVGQDSHSS